MEVLNWHDGPVRKAVQRATHTRLDMAGVYLAGEIKKSFGSASAIGGGTSKAHRAANRSAAGDPPNVDTGLLRRSITHQVFGAASGHLGARVGTFAGVAYALALELGTKVMAARPYLRPALDANKGRLLAILSTPMTSGEKVVAK